MTRKEKKNSAQYQRIMEILEDYWLSEPKEEYVRVEMYFRKSNGEEQEKSIIWTSPEYRRKNRETGKAFLSAADILWEGDE